MTNPITLATQAGLDPWGRGTQRRIKCPIGGHAGDKTRGGYSTVLEVCGEKAGVWYCNRCKQGGTLRDTEGKAPAPMPKPTSAVVTPIDLARVWARIPRGARATEALVGWSAQRGWPADVAQAFARLDDVRWIPEDAPPRDDEDLTTIYYKCRNSHFARPVLFAIRDEQGRVVSAMRRCVGEPTDDRGKALRLPSDLCPVEGALILGSLPQWLDAALAGEPVYVVEGEPDFAVLSVLCVMRGWGAVIGAPSAGALEGVARAAVEGLGKGAARAHVALVPHLGDAKDVGVVSMRAAAQILASAGATCDLCYIARRDTRRSLDVSEILEWGGMDRVEDALVSDIERVEGGPPGRPLVPPHEDGDGGGGEGRDTVLESGSYVVWAREVARMMGTVLYDEGSVWQWQGGVWAQVSPKVVQQYVHRLDGRHYVKGWKDDEEEIGTITLRSEVPTIATQVTALDGVLREGFFADEPAGLTFGNGYLSLGSGGDVTFEAHSPEHGARWQLAWDWSEHERCDVWERCLDEWTAPDLGRWQGKEAPYDLDADAHEKRLFLQEFAGACLLGIAPRYGKCALLPGDGQNGKSKFIEGLLGLFPDGAKSAMNPQQFSGATASYYLAEMSGVRINASTEVPDTEVASSEAFKAIVTGDDITARSPAGLPFTLRSRAGHIFAANNLPPVKDQSRGWWRRFVLIGFERTIPDDRVDPDLGDKIATERAGICRWAIEGAQRLLRQGRYTIPQSSEHAKAQWRAQANSVSAWVEDRTTPTADRDDMVTATEAYSDFKQWAQDSGFRSMSNRKFWRRLQAVLDIKGPIALTRANVYPLRLRGRASAWP